MSPDHHSLQEDPPAEAESAATPRLEPAPAWDTFTEADEPDDAPAPQPDPRPVQGTGVEAGAGSERASEPGPGPEQVQAPAPAAASGSRETLLWTAATARPLDELADLVTLLNEGDTDADGEGAPRLGDEALRAAAVSRPVDEICDLVTMLNEPPRGGDDADTALRAAAVGRPVADVAQLVQLLGASEESADVRPGADDSAPGTRRSTLDRFRTARAARGERTSATEADVRSDTAAVEGEGAPDGREPGQQPAGSAPVGERPPVAPAEARAATRANPSAPAAGKVAGKDTAQASTGSEVRARSGVTAMGSPLRWPTAAALLVLGLIHLPRDFDGLRSGDYTDGASCAAAAVCVALAVLLAVHDTLWAWIAGGAAALGVITLHAVAAALHTRDVLGHSIGGAVGGGGAATLVCAALVVALACTALLYRPPAAQVARSGDRG
ncbi:hypothetical protein SAMN05216223_12094 [Actinacidiphila yanglinensis]|uniref:Uncharacterized protein n=1 Tax=Actinacidiphila yanglinensis TaxID=310779 RepID=A0A1H6DVY2_9ACTN|nr:hypothetical protein [Actinacidiphila yanglinensis]SEG89487.1 hypothetical protein SAMN05216223_12094 [Actinacidiphila yanglinensis]